MVSMKRRTASLALLTVEHLLDSLEPCAGHIVALSLSISGDQNNLPFCNPEKIDYPGAAAFPFPFGGLSQLAATACTGDDVTCVGMIEQKRLQSEKLLVGKEIIFQLGKRRQLNELPQHNLIYGNAVQAVKQK
jgi:hypothetical protein